MKVSIILIAVVAAVAADTYGYDKAYKPAVYTVPSYTASKPVYKEQSYAKETVSYEAPKEVYVAKEPVYKAAAYSAAPAYKPSYNSYKEESYAPAYYKYDYAVKDDYHYVDMDKYETRDGDKTTGSYSVVLPDGRKQIVTYYVDGYSGYVADVKYEGYAKAYDYKPAAYSKPTYTAPAYKADYVPNVAYKTADYKSEY